jgi:hypothetical protein
LESCVIDGAGAVMPGVSVPAAPAVAQLSASSVVAEATAARAQLL